MGEVKNALGQSYCKILKWTTFQVRIEESTWFLTYKYRSKRHRGVVVITPTQLHSTKPELRFCAGSIPALCVSEIHDGEDLWQWSRLEMRLNAFLRSTIPQEQFIIIIIIKRWFVNFSFCMGENAFSQSVCRIHKSAIAQEQLSQSAAINWSKVKGDSKKFG